MSSLPTSSSNSDRRLLDDFVGALSDVSCRVSVQLGTGHLSVRHLLSLERNSVLRLAQTAGEDLHILVHGVAIASGEIVIMEDSTALRVTELATSVTDEEKT